MGDSSEQSIPPPDWGSERPSPLPPTAAPRRLGPVAPRARGQGVALAGLALLIAAVVLVFLLVSGGGSGQTLRGVGFTTTYPAGWTETVTHPGLGATSAVLSSTLSPLNELSIPVPGAMGITVDDIPVSAMASVAPGIGQEGPVQVLQQAVGTPRAAGNLVVIAPPHATTLDGEPAAAVTYAYTYDGVGNVESDVAARHGAQVVTVEEDSEPTASGRAHAAMVKVLSHWRWN